LALIGWKIAGIAGALAAAGATAAPPRTMYLVGYRLWDRFRDAPISRRTLAEGWARRSCAIEPSG